MKILDIIVFAFPYLYYLRPLLSGNNGLRDRAIQQMKNDRKKGIYEYMKEGIIQFLVASIISGYAYLRAELSYLWLIISIVLFFGALLMSAVFFQIYEKQEIPKVPESISEEQIERRVSQNKKILWFQIGFLLIWAYSWKSLFIL